MKAFNEKYNTILETPEHWEQKEGKDLFMNAPDVITFVYMVEPEAIAIAPVGMVITHAKIFSFIKKDLFEDNKYMKVFGEFDKTKMTPDNVITGRLWVNSDKISIWDYEEYGNLNDDNYVRRIINNILKFVNKIHPISINNYEVEVSPTVSPKSGNRKFLI